MSKFTVGDIVECISDNLHAGDCITYGKTYTIKYMEYDTKDKLHYITVKDDNNHYTDWYPERFKIVNPILRNCRKVRRLIV